MEMSRYVHVKGVCLMPHLCLQTVGMVTVVSDNAFEVMNWTYTGMAPSVHWISAKSTSPEDLA